MQKDLTTGSVPQTVIRFAVPYFLSYLLQTLYGMADLFIVGQFDGTASITAVSIGSQVMHMVTVMLVGLAMGATVLIGQAVGARDERRAGLVIGNTVTLFMLLSFALAAVLLTAADGIVTLMATPSQAAAGARSYLVICFSGIPFITAYNIISSVYRGLGDSKSPMCFVAVACAANIGLDFLFIGGMGLGPAGAALGTTLSQGISAAVSLAAVVRRKSGVALRRADLRPRRATMAALLKIGLPISLQDGFVQVSFVIITIFANRRGLVDSAAVGIVEKIIGMAFLVPSSMLSTTSALCSQSVGAGLHDRAGKILRCACLIAVGWGLAVSLAMQFAAEALIGLFTADAAVVAAGGQYIRSYIWDCMLAGVHFSFSGYFCAYGLSMVSFLHNSISILCARIPLSWYASTHFPDTLFPMGLASTTGSLVSIVVCAAAFAYLRRREKQRAGRAP